MISTQVETIFAIDKLTQEIERLRSGLDRSSKESGQLERSNYKLQIAILIATTVGALNIIIPILKTFASWIANAILPVLHRLTEINFGQPETVAFLTTILSVISAIVTFIAGRKVIQFEDNIKVRDSIEMVLTDRNGKIKETRKQ